MPVTFYPPEMTPDRCDVFDAGAPGSARDNSGGREASPATPRLTGFPCSYQPELASDVQAVQAVQARSNAHVLFTSDPGDLRDGARLVVTHRGGQALGRAIGLKVNQLVREGLAPDVSVWRADCSGAS